LGRPSVGLEVVLAARLAGAERVARERVAKLAQDCEPLSPLARFGVWWT